MGTETSGITGLSVYNMALEVKLNNPQMGTET